MFSSSVDGSPLSCSLTIAAVAAAFSCYDSSIPRRTATDFTTHIVSDALLQASPWTIRRCCAIDLDTLASTFEDALVPSLLENLSACFRVPGDSSDAWLTRESGLLALGCVADGCGIHLSEHFSALMPYLIAQVKDRRVRLQV